MPALVDFHEVRFPTDIALGSTGGPGRQTEIVTLGSGFEHRNQRWVHSRRRFDAGTGIKTLNALYEVADFFEARRGPLHGFRFRDPLDWKSCAPQNAPSNLDQEIGVGDGTKSDFQLIKSYGPADNVYTRNVVKPVAGTVGIAVDGLDLTLSVDFTIDRTTGIVTFLPGSIPSNGAVITAGFEFDVPVRFSDDQLIMSVSGFAAGEVPSIPLVELVT